MHELARRVDGVKAAAVHARVADIDPASLPSVEQAKTQQHARQVERENRQAHDIAALRGAIHEAHAGGKGQGRYDDTRRRTFAGRAGSRHQSEPEAPIYRSRRGRPRHGRRRCEAASPARRAASGPRRHAGRETRGAGQGPSGGRHSRPEPEDMRPLGKTAATSAWHGRLSRTAERSVEDALAARGHHACRSQPRGSAAERTRCGLRQGSRQLRPRAGGKARSSPSTRMATCTGSTSAPPATCAPRSRRGLTALPASIAPRLLNVTDTKEAMQRSIARGVAGRAPRRTGHGATADRHRDDDCRSPRSTHDRHRICRRTRQGGLDHHARDRGRSARPRRLAAGRGTGRLPSPTPKGRRTPPATSTRCRRATSPP